MYLSFSIYLSIYLSICRFTHQCVYLFIFLLYIQSINHQLPPISIQTKNTNPPITTTNIIITVIIIIIITTTTTTTTTATTINTLDPPPSDRTSESSKRRHVQGQGLPHGPGGEDEGSIKHQDPCQGDQPGPRHHSLEQTTQHQPGRPETDEDGQKPDRLHVCFRS